MAEFPAPNAGTAVPQPPISAGLLAYALFGVAAVTALVSSGFPFVAPFLGLVGIAGLIVAYVKRDDARGTWVESHLTWLIRTFWYSFLWGVIGGVVLVVLGIILIGIPIALLIWAVASIWVLYRVIRGYLLFKDSKPIPRHVTSSSLRAAQAAMRPSTPNSSWFPRWTLREGGVIAPDERLPTGQTIALGIQHVVAMFGATVLAPLLMGFNPNVAILFSGIGTLVFFVAVGGRVPSYLGSSFSFIAVVIAATGYAGSGLNANLPVALGGIVAAGALYAAIGLIVMKVGYAWIDRLMPPPVTGAVVAVIGLNLAPIAVKNIAGSSFDTWIGIATVLAVGLVAVRAPGLTRRLPILLGGLMGYVIYAALANGFGLGKPIDFSPVFAAPWIGLPHFEFPMWSVQAITLIAPVAIVLVAENLGHVKAVAAMTGQNLDPYLGRAFLGDGIATMIAGAGGGTGVTTYAENIGVMAVTRIYSTLVFVVAALCAIVLGFSPKFGALIMTIPGPVLGGLAIVVFGLITAMGARIWVQNRVDFSRARNLITVAVTLTVGAGDLALKFGGFTLGGIGTATFGAILLYQLLGEDRAEPSVRR